MLSHLQGARSGYNTRQHFIQVQTGESSPDTAECRRHTASSILPHPASHLEGWGRGKPCSQELLFSHPNEVSRSLEMLTIAAHFSYKQSFLKVSFISASEQKDLNSLEDLAPRIHAAIKSTYHAHVPCCC